MKISDETGVRSRENHTLVIMAKAPRPGLVKTRLTENLPVAAVIALYRCLLEDTVALANSLSGVHVAVMCPESHEDELANLLGHRVEILTQKGSGLAAGLTSVFEHFTSPISQRVIAFNSDSPHLAPSVLDNAFEMLATHDMVVGPTFDGGYYLVGAKAAHSTLFETDGLGTRSALDRLLARISQLGLSAAFTEPFYDIDVADDLIRLAQELQLDPSKASRTAGWLREWERTLAVLHARAREQ